MAVQSPPFVVQNGSHSAALFRQALGSMLYAPGPLSGSDYAVSAQPTPNMTVQVSAGQAWIDGSAVGNISGQIYSTQGSYFLLNDGTVTLTIATANATNPRIDLVCLSVTDSAYSGATNTGQLSVITGTPAATPLAPAAPANSIILCQVRVNAAATSITNSNLTPVTSTTGVTGTGGNLQQAFGAQVMGTPIFAPSTALPAGGAAGIRIGQLLLESDTLLMKVWAGRWAAYGQIASGHAWIYQSVTQSVPAATLTTITLDAVTYDNNSGHNGTGGYTIPAGYGGLYLIEGGVVLTGMTTSTGMACAIGVNGSYYAGSYGANSPSIAGSTNISSVTTGSRAYALAAGDVVTLAATCGAASNTAINGSQSSWMSLTMVGFT